MEDYNIDVNAKLDMMLGNSSDDSDYDDADADTE
jgi:hypothetical protein